MELITGENDKGRRLDRILRKALPDTPLSLIHRLLRQGQVLVDGKPAKAQDRAENGMTIHISSINSIAKPLIKSCALPSPDIIWQDLGLLAVNKPPGIAVHGHDSLESMVRFFLADKLPPSLSFKSGPLHRLDKPSSGIVVFSTSLEGARLFSFMLHERKVQKTYLAIVEGKVKKEEFWLDSLIRDKEKKKTLVLHSNIDIAGEASSPCDEVPSRGKTAITKITQLAAEDNYSLIKAEIVTGRTHQIRAQAAAGGHPLLGDVKYGGSIFNEQSVISSKKYPKNGRQTVDFFLHAWKLDFLDHSIEAPLPQAFKEKTASLFGVDL